MSTHSSSSKRSVSTTSTANTNSNAQYLQEIEHLVVTGREGGLTFVEWRALAQDRSLRQQLSHVLPDLVEAVLVNRTVYLSLKDLKEFVNTKDVKPTEWSTHTYVSMETQTDISLLGYNKLLIHEYQPIAIFQRT